MLHGPLEVVIPSYQTISRNLQNDFVGPIYPGNTNEATTQTIASSSQRETPRSNDADPLRVERPRPLPQRG